MPTTGISLVRENAEALRPPRSLWVPFPLGRPLGAPNEVAFQHRVLAHGLRLLFETKGPVLEDFPDDAPTTAAAEVTSCPVTFPVEYDLDTWEGRLTSEHRELAPWYELGRRRRHGRTLVGISGESVPEEIARLARLLDAEALPKPADLQGFKLAIEDLKAFYIEAMTAEGGAFDQTEIYATLYHETEFGRALRWFHDALSVHPKMHLLARIVLPREAVDPPGDITKP